MDRDTAYNRIAYGFDIFRQFLKDEKDHMVSAEHDVIYAGPDPVDVPEEYKEKLAELGWYPCSEFDCFCHYT